MCDELWTTRNISRADPSSAVFHPRFNGDKGEFRSSTFPPPGSEPDVAEQVNSIETRGDALFWQKGEREGDRISSGGGI